MMGLKVFEQVFEKSLRVQELHVDKKKFYRLPWKMKYFRKWKEYKQRCTKKC